jgi:DNA-binding transcriptional LysR family regulator
MGPEMDLRQINAFVAVAEERSFTKAARRLYISQPPLSRQVRQLEIELGVALFVRHHAGTTLTNEGQILLEKARTAAAAATDLREAAQALKDPGARVVHVGMAWGLWNVVERIGAHHAQRCPETRLVAVSDFCSPCGMMDRQGELDVAIVRTATDHSRYESALLFNEQLVAVLGATHALASRKKLRLADLASEPLLMYDRRVGPGLYDKTFALYTAAGIRPCLVEAQPPPNAPGAMRLVASGQGFYLSIASPFTQAHRDRGVTVIPIEEPNARIEVRIAWPKGDSSSSVREFLRSARDIFPLKQREGVASGRRSPTRTPPPGSSARPLHGLASAPDKRAASIARG